MRVDYPEAEITHQLAVNSRSQMLHTCFFLGEDCSFSTALNTGTHPHRGANLKTATLDGNGIPAHGHPGCEET